MEYGKYSDVGRVRLENQDRVAIFKKDSFYFLILCDGMGGHYGGALASNTTINTFDKQFYKTLPDKNSEEIEFHKWFKKTIDLSRLEMIKISSGDEAKLDMGTTVTAVLVNKSKKQIYIYNVGDSRTYALTTGGDLQQVTIDHNLLNQLVLEEKVPLLEAKQNPYNAALTSALGPNKKTKIEVFNGISKNYDNIYSFLVTSDGVHDFIEKPEMERIMKKDKNPEEICKELVLEALDNKSTDNASAGILILDNKEGWK